MTWNLKYSGTNHDNMTLAPGATVATDPIQFYGYYTLDFERDGKVAGMLSGNGYSGQFFLHTSPSTFVEEAE